MRTDLPGATASVSGSDRAEVLDGLRGFALFGILVANLSVFTGYWALPDQERAVQFGAAAAQHVAFGIEWLITGKFYSIFSLLFGIGFAIQLQRLEARGEAVSRYVRRLMILLCIGLAHILLLWFGDILSLYALMGLVLLLFRRASDRMLLLMAVLLWTVPIVWEWAKVSGFKPHQPFEAAESATHAYFGLDLSAGYFAVLKNPDYLFHLKLQAADLFYRFGQLTSEMRPAKVLAMFMIGLWVGRRFLFLRLDDYAPLLRRVAVAGFLIGLAASGLMAWLSTLENSSDATRIVKVATYSLGVPTLALAYASTFALLWRTHAQRFLSVFSPAGRMALTNYLAQTLIQCLIFHGYGLGLVGEVSITWVPLIAVVIFGFQLSYSRFWLSQFRFGPMEWLWRSLTYGTPQPMFNRPGRAAAAS